MSMRWKSGKRLTICLNVLLILALASCTRDKMSAEIEGEIRVGGEYICPMVCEGNVTYSLPGNCPVCKMKLIRISEKLVQTVSPGRQVLSHQATFRLKADMNVQTVSSQGFIAQNPNLDHTISARFGGRIEKIFIRNNGQFVNKGDKIMELYSPQLNTFLEEHLFLLKTEKDKKLIEHSREKLKLLGVSDQDISNLEVQGNIAKTISVFSPFGGFVRFNTESDSWAGKNNSGQSSGTQMNMSGSSQANEISVSAGGRIREGRYIETGEALFTVNNLSAVWAVLSVPSDFLSKIPSNGKVFLVSELFPDRKITGNILLIEQAFNEEKQQFARLRVEVMNPDAFLKINSLISAEVPLSGATGFSVPASSVLFTGLNAFVWVKQGTTKNGAGIFELRKISTGGIVNRKVIVLSGLSQNEEIAIQAGAMTDSETFLNGN